MKLATKFGGPSRVMARPGKRVPRQPAHQFGFEGFGGRGACREFWHRRSKAPI